MILTCSHSHVKMLLQVAQAEKASFEVVRSIYSQQMKTLAKTTRARGRGVARNDVAREYGQYVESGHTMLELAIDHRVAPVTMACSILEGLIDLSHPIVQAREAELAKSKTKFNRRRDLVKDLLPTCFAAGASAAGTFPVAAEFCMESSRLHKDVVECILADDTAGPLVDRIRHTVGLEYE